MRASKSAVWYGVVVVVVVFAVCVRVCACGVVVVVVYVCMCASVHTYILVYVFRLCIFCLYYVFLIECPCLARCLGMMEIIWINQAWLYIIKYFHYIYHERNHLFSTTGHRSHSFLFIIPIFISIT